MSIGLIILIITGLLVIFGAGQRALDRLRLTDKQALLCIALIIGLGASEQALQILRQALVVHIFSHVLPPGVAG